MAKVKYPIKAALARFLPIYNHLTNMAGYLSEAGHTELAQRVFDFNSNLRVFEKAVKPLAVTENRKLKTGNP
jgi:hypothetical protein